MRQRFSRQQRIQWLDEFEQSDQTAWEFCTGKRIRSKSFYRRRRELRGELNQSNCKHDPHFVPVTLIGSPVVEIAMPCGAKIRLTYDSSSLRPVLLALLEVEACP